MLEIRNSKMSDLEDIERIYQHAREEMVKSGNPHQWKNTEPKIEKIIKDINSNNHCIIVDENHICGVFSMFFKEDPTYRYIEGKWENDFPYITIHSIASDNTNKNILLTAINYAFQFRNTVRIDTHKDNKIMQHLLNKYDFKYCGIIYLENGEPRLAFMKTI